MTRHRLVLLIVCSMVLSACGTGGDEPPDPGTSHDTLSKCHPFAETATEPARSQRATTPPTDVVAFVPPAAPAYEGALTPNTALAGAEHFGGAILDRPEDIAFDAQGRLYTGSGDGNVWRASIDANGSLSDFTVFAAVGQRPLGLAFDPCGNVVAAVPNRGLVAISPEGQVRTIADRVDGTRIEFADELAIAEDGTIYVTEASTKYDRAWPYEFLEGRPHGRILRYEPATGEVRVLLGDELYFPNGIAVAGDESYVLFAESMRARVRRHWLSGPKTGTTEPLAENLPVIADNISVDEQGSIWVAGARRTAELDQLTASREARMALLQRTPEELGGHAPVDPYRLVVVLNNHGEIIRSLHDSTGQLIPLSSAIVHGSHLYLGTNEGKGIARVALPAP